MSSSNALFSGYNQEWAEGTQRFLKKIYVMREVTLVGKTCPSENFFHVSVERFFVVAVVVVKQLSYNFYQNLITFRE